MKHKQMSYGQLFVIFLKAGLAFGGGLGVIFAMQEQLVDKHRFMSKKEFMALYAVGRVVPSGTVSALSIAIGYKYKKFPGIFLALLGVMLPGFTLTLLLAAMYTFFKQSHVFEIINYSIMPAAVGLIFIAALNMGKDTFHSPLLISFVVASFVLSVFMGVNAAVVLLAGGFIGTIIFSKIKEGHDLPY
jgi:chromate transporter